MDIERSFCWGCMSPDIEGVCPYCGHDNNAPSDPNFIKPGTFLDPYYVIGAAEHYNGESVTYIGYDQKHQHKVWIKEYSPTSLSYRDVQTQEILPKNGSGPQYKALLSDFVDLNNEVRELAQNHPIIPVENMVGENNTVYVIFSHLDVVSFEEYLIAKGGNLSADDAHTILTPLLNTVDNIHIRGMIHRGLSPYTIYIDNNERIYIDAFSLGATRTGGSELVAELYNGYSAPEQYVSTGWQGTWTDVYALGAIYYRTISGIVPPRATRINRQSPLAPLKEQVYGVQDNISNAVEAAMETSAQQRTQTVAAFLANFTTDEGLAGTAVFNPNLLAPIKIQQEDIFRGDDEFGHTENISTPKELENFRNEFRARAEQQEKERQQIQREREYHSPPQQEEPQPPKSRKALLTIIVGVLLIGVTLALVVNASLNKNKPVEKPEEPSTPTSVVEEVEEPPETPQETSNKNTVPNFVGKKIATIENNEEYTDIFHLNITEAYSSEYKEGEVAKQSPPPGTVLPVNGTVVLTVSKGSFTVTMPDLTGMELEEALQTLKRETQSLDIEFEDLKIAEMKKYQKDSDPGVVLSTNPVPNANFNPLEDTIEIYVSLGSTTSESSKTPSSQVTVPPKEESSKPSSKKPPSPPVSRKDGDTDISPNIPTVD